MKKTTATTGTDPRAQINQLRLMSVPELRRWHLEWFGQEATSNHRRFLFRQIARRLQASIEPPLSEEARQFALALARGSALDRRMVTNVQRRREGLPIDLTVKTKLPNAADSRMPMPGSLVTREYKGQLIVVAVLKDGVEYDGRKFSSLSAVAQEVTGVKWNGFRFFGLLDKECAGRKEKRVATRNI
ncbi:MAG: DUF2924 domain-containing protein [Bryobacterales bacterium]|nr:DUF2924 domain-containing protein [Bryobacterales bacterium]